MSQVSCLATQPFAESRAPREVAGRRIVEAAAAVDDLADESPRGASYAHPFDTAARSVGVPKISVPATGMSSAFASGTFSAASAYVNRSRNALDVAAERNRSKL
jgi:hypothetical protein